MTNRVAAARLAASHAKAVSGTLITLTATPDKVLPLQGVASQFKRLRDNQVPTSSVISEHDL